MKPQQQKLCTAVLKVSFSTAKPNKKQPVLTVFSSPTCSLCLPFKKHLEPFSDQIVLKEIDISKTENAKWFELYKYDIPVLHFNDHLLFKHRFDKKSLEEKLKQFVESDKEEN